MGKGNDMRSVKAFISVVLVAVFTLGVVSCGKAVESRETQRTLSSEEQLNKEKMEKSGAIYVMVGTDYDGKMQPGQLLRRTARLTNIRAAVTSA